MRICEQLACEVARRQEASKSLAIAFRPVGSRSGHVRAVFAGGDAGRDAAEVTSFHIANARSRGDTGSFESAQRGYAPYRRGTGQSSSRVCCRGMRKDTRAKEVGLGGNEDVEGNEQGLECAAVQVWYFSERFSSCRSGLCEFGEGSVEGSEQTSKAMTSHLLLSGRTLELGRPPCGCCRGFARLSSNTPHQPTAATAPSNVARGRLAFHHLPPLSTSRVDLRYSRRRRLDRRRGRLYASPRPPHRRLHERAADRGASVVSPRGTGGRASRIGSADIVCKKIAAGWGITGSSPTSRRALAKRQS